MFLSWTLNFVRDFNKIYELLLFWIKSMEECVLGTNAGKQQSLAATDV